MTPRGRLFTASLFKNTFLFQLKEFLHLLSGFICCWWVPSHKPPPPINGLTLLNTRSWSKQPEVWDAASASRCNGLTPRPPSRPGGANKTSVSGLAAPPPPPPTVPLPSHCSALPHVQSCCWKAYSKHVHEPNRLTTAVRLEKQQALNWQIKKINEISTIWTSRGILKQLRDSRILQPPNHKK